MTRTTALDDELLVLERKFWFGDAAFYDAHLAPGCRMALPGMGLVDRETAIAGIAAGPRWDTVEMADAEVRLLGDAAAVVSYAAKATRGDKAYATVVGSAYTNDGGSWKLAYHQHSPVPG